MHAPIGYLFHEAEIDYRHERLMNEVRQSQAIRRPVSVAVREFFAGARHRRPVVRRPMPAPHHLAKAHARSAV